MTPDNSPDAARHHSDRGGPERIFSDQTTQPDQRKCSWLIVLPKIEALLAAGKHPEALALVSLALADFRHHPTADSTHHTAAARTAATLLKEAGQLPEAEAMQREATTLSRAQQARASSSSQNQNFGTDLIDLAALIILQKDRRTETRLSECHQLISEAQEFWQGQRDALVLSGAQQCGTPEYELLHSRGVDALLKIATLWQAAGEPQLQSGVLAEAAAFSLLWEQSNSHPVIETRYKIIDQLGAIGNFELAQHLIAKNLLLLQSCHASDPLLLLHQAQHAAALFRSGAADRAVDQSLETLERAALKDSDTLLEVSALCNFTLGQVALRDGDSSGLEDLATGMYWEQQRQLPNAERLACISLLQAQALADILERDSSVAEDQRKLIAAVEAYGQAASNAQLLSTANPRLSFEMLHRCTFFFCDHALWDTARLHARNARKISVTVWGATSPEFFEAAQIQRTIECLAGPGCEGKAEAYFREELAAGLARKESDPDDAIQTYRDFSSFAAEGGQRGYALELTREWGHYAKTEFGSRSVEYAESLLELVSLRLRSDDLTERDLRRVKLAKKILIANPGGSQDPEENDRCGLLLARALYLRGLFHLDSEQDSAASRQVAQRYFARAQRAFMQRQLAWGERDIRALVELQLVRGHLMIDSYHLIPQQATLKAAVAELRLGYEIAEQHASGAPPEILELLITGLAELGQKNSAEARKYRQQLRSYKSEPPGTGPDAPQD